MEFRTTILEKNGVIAEFINEWTQLPLTRFNWIEITPLGWYMEIDRRSGAFEIELYLLGFGFRISWVYNIKRNRAYYRKLTKSMKKEFGCACE